MFDNIFPLKNKLQVGSSHFLRKCSHPNFWSIMTNDATWRPPNILLELNIKMIIQLLIDGKLFLSFALRCIKYLLELFVQYRKIHDGTFNAFERFFVKNKQAFGIAFGDCFGAQDLDQE